MMGTRTLPSVPDISWLMCESLVVLQLTNVKLGILMIASENPNPIDADHIPVLGSASASHFYCPETVTIEIIRVFRVKLRNSMIMVEKRSQYMKKMASIIESPAATYIEFRERRHSEGTDNGIRGAFFCVLLILLAACDSRSGPGPDIHDSKYVALGADGKQLASGEPGPCVLDQFTGLVWEVKATEGLHNRDYTYSWFSPDEDAGGELDYRGKQDGGECSGSACDTHAFVQAVNMQGLCGFHDWRLPVRDELGSISDPRKTLSPPTINTTYFPNTRSSEYWSSNDYQFHWDTAWLWSFENGMDRVEWKSSPRHVRLVRGQAVYLERIED